MAWTTLTTDEVLQEFNSAEKSALDNTKGDDSLPGIVSRVVSEFRDAIIAGGSAVGDTGMIPEGLQGYAVALARWRFLLSLPKNSSIQTQDRKDAASRAQDVVDAIASGDRKVESPDGGVSESGGVQVISERTNKVTGDSLKGL